MNRIVREHYPVSQLPAELRDELGGVQEVRVVIEVADQDSRGITAETNAKEQRPFSRFRHLAPNNFETAEELIDHVRALRDEWNQRESFHDRLRDSR